MTNVQSVQYAQQAYASIHKIVSQSHSRSLAHLISSINKRQSPLRPSLLRAVSVREQKTRSGTAITTGEGGRTVLMAKGFWGARSEL